MAEGQAPSQELSLVASWSPYESRDGQPRAHTTELAAVEPGLNPRLSASAAGGRGTTSVAPLSQAGRDCVSRAPWWWRVSVCATLTPPWRALEHN